MISGLNDLKDELKGAPRTLASTLEKKNASSSSNFVTITTTTTTTTLHSHMLRTGIYFSGRYVHGTRWSGV